MIPKSRIDEIREKVSSGNFCGYKGNNRCDLDVQTILQAYDEQRAKLEECYKIFKDQEICPRELGDWDGH